MTRKRAIELARAAVVRDCPPGKLPPHWPAVECGLELAVEHGVVIGMRKAKGWCVSNYDRELITAEANRLARKLRGAR